MDEKNYRYILKNMPNGLKNIGKFKDHKARLKELYGFTDADLERLEKSKQPEIKKTKEALERLF